MKLWGSRMEKDLDAEVFSFSTSIGDDYLLYPYDIWGSIAHCLGLARAGLLSEDEKNRLVSGLREVYRDLEDGRIDPSPFEDVHSLVEIALRERVGEVAGKLHTGRSRNDQVVLDERLYLREKVAECIEGVLALESALLRRAEEYRDIVMPGFTHLQPAQPVLFSYHLLAYFFMLQRDIERLKEALRRVNVSPLGSAALCGTSLPLDRFFVAELLAFPRVQDHAMDAVSDRDFILDVLHALAVLALHLSRFGEEVVLWSTPFFSFLTIDDAFTTGSSIMPQKKNPDVAELIRGKAGEILSSWVSLAVTLKGLPLSYNRDLQQDKRPLFRAVNEGLGVVVIATRLVNHVFPQPERMRRALEEGFLTATDLCEYLVTRGLPFRKAHELVGRVVRKLIGEGRTLKDLVPEDFGEWAHLFDEGVQMVVLEERSVARKSTFGSTAPGEVLRMCAEGRAYVEKEQEEIAGLKKEWQKSFRELVGEKRR
ncbi:argininosuccinate lyase [Candidatus Caldatribacterium sp. SIUC1]|uniref:argininosuccinate lyase n=1 Tax=Candidatus Caldatribacterium sp. SIUC1 TaxID=3418365 RepID=UPI003F6901EE